MCDTESKMEELPMCVTIMSCHFPIPSQQTRRIDGAILQSNIADMLYDPTLLYTMTENLSPVHVTDALVPLHQGVRRGEARVVEVRPMVLSMHPPSLFRQSPSAQSDWSSLYPSRRGNQKPPQPKTIPLSNLPAKNASL